MNTLSLAAAVALSLAAASMADARPLIGDAVAAAAAAAAAAASRATGCQEDFCPQNGPQLTGMALPDVEATQPIVNAVTLPSGETVDLR